MRHSGNRSWQGITRRSFVGAAGATAAAAVSASVYGNAFGANERIGVGVIGFGLIGRIHLRNFKAQPDVNLVAVAETYRPRLEAAAAMCDGKVAQYGDFRRMLDRKDLDAVVVATPDHWHALMTMLACAAGKDVYVEKPLTLFVREGQWMLEVARRTKRVIQVGTQQRSGGHYRRAREAVRSGKIGQLVSVECRYFRNVSPGFGNPPDQDPPPDLDWEMFLGPAPWRRYNPNRGIYHFRWFWDYSGGQMTNLGQHSLDTMYWFYDLKGPKAVTSAGGRLFLKDNCEVPDTQDVIIEYPGFTAVVQWRECAAGAGETGMGSLNFLGTKGTLELSRDYYRIVPDKKENPNNIVARILGGHPVGGPQLVPDQPTLWTEPAEDRTGNWNEQYIGHVRDFLECIKTRRQPVANLLDAHRVATVCHLANISLLTGRKIYWDADNEQIIGDPQAAAMLVRPYRKPWDAELRALGVGGA